MSFSEENFVFCREITCQKQPQHALTQLLGLDALETAIPGLPPTGLQPVSKQRVPEEEPARPRSDSKSKSAGEGTEKTSEEWQEV